MALKTYGTKPISFQLKKKGEYYCIGSQVGKYLGTNNLYNIYPGIFKRWITKKQRERLARLGLSREAPNNYSILLRVREVEDIIKGNGDKYKTASIDSTKPCDAVLPARPITRKRLHNEKVRTLSPYCNDRNPSSASMKTAKQKISMPLRTDEEIEARRLGDISICNNNAKRVSREDFIATEMEEEETKGAENSSQLEATCNQKCRLCLKKHNQFVELFGSDGILLLKIMALAPVKIEHDDGLPGVICVTCCQLLDISYNFKCLVEKSDTVLRALLDHSAVYAEIEINHNAVKESSHLKRKHLPLQKNNHLVSNDYNNRQDSVAREIDKECCWMSGNNNSHKKTGPEDKDKDNELDNEKQAEKDDNTNESEIIPRVNRSEILLEDALDDEVSESVSQSLQTMEFESEPMKKEELLLQEEIDLSEREDNPISGQEYKANVPIWSSNNLELPSHNTIHENATELRYTCYWCGKNLSDVAKLMNHITNNHGSLNNDNRVDIDNNNYGKGKT